MKFNEIYKEIVDDLQPSEELANRLQIREETKLMRLNKKKVVVVAAVACMAFGMTAFAAGKIASYRSWSNPRNEISDYSEAVTKSEELGSELIIPDTFSNGYTFDAANTMGVEGLDDNGNVIVSGTGFSTRYVKDSMPDISLYINQVYESGEESYAIDSKKIGDVEVYFNQAVYKFVPVGYELTEEDKKNIEDPHFEMSYGSNQVEIKNCNGISFEKDGKYYNMFAWDCDMTADEWYEMAEELLAK